MSIHHFEALNYALRKSKDGVIVSFVVHPSDVDAELTSLPIGARVKIAWTMADDEKPVAASSNGKTSGLGPEDVGSTPTAAAKTKPKRKFADLSLPEQCALRCEDPRFQRFIEGMYQPAFFDEFGVVGCVRDYLCVQSRSALSIDHDAANKWRALEYQYQRWLTDETYKDSVR